MIFARFTASLLALCAASAADPGMVFIPGGEYLRGRSHNLSDDGLKWYPVLLQDDRPVKRIAVDPFYLDTHEVTNEEYAVFVRANRRKAPPHWPEGHVPPGKERQPVANVDWNDAVAYCAWQGKRLPTEAEWERAARGLGEARKHPWGDRNATKKDACYDSQKGPCEVGKFPPNGFGLFDMAGNVWEWCADWYEKDYYAVAPERNPRGPESGLYRVLRGGSWADVPKYLTVSHRTWARPAEKSPNIGFRCAKSLVGAKRSAAQLPNR